MKQGGPYNTFEYAINCKACNWLIDLNTEVFTLLAYRS